MRYLLSAFAVWAWGVGHAYDPVPASQLDGLYTYVATDSTGAPVLEGSLELSFHENFTVRGSWNISAVEPHVSVQTVGPQIGEGTLEGEWVLGEQLRVTLNMNPAMRDNNVSVGGVVSPEQTRLTGTWRYATLLGRVAQGGFTATRRR